MLVSPVESTASLLALGAVTSRPTQDRTLTGSLRALGLTTVLGGVLGSFISTSYAQNVGLVALSRIRSRYVVTLCGVFLVLMGLVPVLGSLVALVPLPVLGGAGVVFFCRHPAEPSAQPPRPRHRSRTSTRFPPSGSPRSAAPPPLGPASPYAPSPVWSPFCTTAAPDPQAVPQPPPRGPLVGDWPAYDTDLVTHTPDTDRDPGTAAYAPSASEGVSFPGPLHPLHPLHSLHPLRNRSGHPNDPTTHGRDARSGWHRPVGAIRDARRGNAER
ncbi:solute carrier family 23 protein [Streptomyces sp. NPDC017868]|uniref:solute carrier family 23 protein n=1 Tax=Streptomyces sp. NPDC017868 TaxID=3365014 RepID=UPI003797FC00